MTIAVWAVEPAAITHHFPFLGSTRANVEVSRQWSRELVRSLSASVRTIQSACCSSSLSHAYPVRRGIPMRTSHKGEGQTERDGIAFGLRCHPAVFLFLRMRLHSAQRSSGV